MKQKTQTMTLAITLLLTATCLAQAPAGAPAGTTGLCKDGTYSSAETKKGACSSHHGVQTWYGTPSGSPPAASTNKAAPSSAATGASSAASSAAPASANKNGGTPGVAAAAGGGPGQVWVNLKSKVYHCAGDRWYGKTEEGQYMSEADASAKGFRPDHGKACK